jgi:hypothetical protein
MELHAVIIKKPIELNDAKEIAKHFIPSNKKFYRETESSYRFRNIPKTQFKKGSFRTKIINDNVSIVLGDRL